MAYGLLILSTQRRKSTKMLCLMRSFLASVFFVVQLSTLLLVPSCSAENISSSTTTYRYTLDHHKRHFHQDHPSETSIISSKELYRKDISTETPKIGHDGIQEQYITSVNEENSAKQVVAASVNTQNFSNQNHQQYQQEVRVLY